MTPSHNPPRDGGFKYNPPNGGPADTDATGWIADRANELIAADLEGVARTPFRDIDADTLGEYDFRDAYVRDLANIIDIEAIRRAGVRIGADPLGGASVEYWALIAEVHGARPHGREPRRRPDMAVHDARLGREDPHGPVVAVGDGRPDRPSRRVRHPHRQRRRRRPPRHRHARRRPDEPQPLPRRRDRLPVLAPPAMADGCRDRQDARQLDDHRPRRRIAGASTLLEVPVGFKWFVPGLLDGSVAFGGEESAGASFLRRTGASGRPTRTASCCASSPPRSSR